MTPGRRSFLIAAVAAGFGGAGAYLSHRLVTPRENSPDLAAAGQMLLHANFTGLKDEPQSLQQWAGKVLVVNFWATWCDPCKEEIPAFIQIQQEYASKNVQFVGIAIDQKDRVIPYMRQIGFNYPVVIGGIDSMVLARYAGNSKEVIPFTAVIDTSGKVIANAVGTYQPEKLRDTLNNTLTSAVKM